MVNHHSRNQANQVTGKNQVTGTKHGKTRVTKFCLLWILYWLVPVVIQRVINFCSLPCTEWRWLGTSQDSECDRLSVERPGYRRTKAIKRPRENKNTPSLMRKYLKGLGTRLVHVKLLISSKSPLYFERLFKRNIVWFVTKWPKESEIN